MASAPADGARKARAGALIAACIAEQGSAAHPYFASAQLLRGPDASRNLADAVHFICILHGRHPGVIDLAAEREVDASAQAWLEQAAAAFAAERHYLTRLAVAAGPVPGTPGGSASEAAVIGQRGAIATLARSERRGCALGAALGLAADWTRIRPALDVAARRLGVEAPASALSDLESIRSAAEAASGSPPVERALLFGTEQILVQHHGLWALLEARAQARGHG
ncbi:DUF6975 family protein [Allosphingosinicella sp.]|jgi:hypothetical protein|uniref:DUF6975 family protein n=1 Tax=Allosphingosinicella sp. TaxID=2823234 RepID=UPI002F0FB2DC